MSETCLRFVLDFPFIGIRFVWDLLYIGLRFVLELLEIFLRIVWDLGDICSRFVWVIPWCRMMENGDDCTIWKNLTHWLSEDLTSKEAIASKTSTKSVQRCVSLCKVKKVEHNVKRNTLTFFLYIRKKFIRTASLKISWKTKNIQRLPDYFLKNQL